MKDNKAYDELSIIISQQSILSQKVGILFAVNIIIVGFIISLAAGIQCLWILFAIIPWFVSILINVYILFPKFQSSNNSKYFYNFADMSEIEIEKIINNEQNTLSQIKTNSSILKNKYNLYKHSLAISFLFIPYLFLINRKNKS